MAKTVASFTTETDDMMHVVHMNNSRRFYVTSTDYTGGETIVVLSEPEAIKLAHKIIAATES